MSVLLDGDDCYSLTSTQQLVHLDRLNLLLLLKAADEIYGWGEVGGGGVDMTARKGALADRELNPDLLHRGHPCYPLHHLFPVSIALI